MPDIQHAITIDAPPDRIVRLVSSGDGFSAWWAEDVQRDGDAVALGFFNRSTVYRLVAQPEPDGTRWRCETGREWAGTSLVFRLRPEGARTRLEFAHEGWEAATPYFVSCNTTWGHLMFHLKDAAEHDGLRRPFFTRSGTAGSSAATY